MQYSCYKYGLLRQLAGVGMLVLFLGSLKQAGLRPGDALNTEISGPSLHI